MIILIAIKAFLVISVINNNVIFSIIIATYSYMIVMVT